LSCKSEAGNTRGKSLKAGDIQHKKKHRERKLRLAGLRSIDFDWLFASKPEWARIASRELPKNLKMNSCDLSDVTLRVFLDTFFTPVVSLF